MEFTILNEQLKVVLESKGAEPQSIVAEGLERLWQADPTVWNRHAPLLFPLIGRLRDGAYELDGQPVAAPKHGFCRDRAFAATQVSDACVRFTTASDQETRQVFPFDFTLEVEFSLEGATLVKTHRITNTGARPMPFELGGHEAYATRLLPGEHMADYYVTFGTSSNDDCLLEVFDMDAEGILSLPKRAIQLNAGRLDRVPEQCDLDTFVLENVPDSTATLHCTVNNHTVTIQFPDFPYLGIWSMAGQADPRYLCIEPWSALPDGHFMPGELGEKPGVITVEPGATKTLTYRMTFA